MLEVEIAVIEVATRQRLRRVGEGLRRRVGRAVVGDDDLGGDAACDEVLRACGEARR
jgi:hypothetical protein